MTDPTPSLEDLVSIEQIKQLKARYFRLLDTQQWTDWGEVFAEDGVMDVSDDTGSRETGLVRGRVRIVKAVSGMLSGARTVHHGHMPEIELLSATEARGVWAMFDYIEFKPSRGIRGYGHYHEEYRKEAGKWHISKLKLTRLRVDPLG